MAVDWEKELADVPVKGKSEDWESVLGEFDPKHFVDTMRTADAADAEVKKNTSPPPSTINLPSPEEFSQRSAEFAKQPDTIPAGATGTDAGVMASGKFGPPPEPPSRMEQWIRGAARLPQAPPQFEHLTPEEKDQFAGWAGAYNDADKLTDHNLDQEEMLKQERSLAATYPKEHRDKLLAAISDLAEEKKSKDQFGFGGRTVAAYTRGAGEAGSEISDIIGQRKAGGSLPPLSLEDQRFAGKIQQAREQRDPLNPYAAYDPRSWVVGTAHAGVKLAGAVAAGPAGAAVFAPGMYQAGRREGYSPATSAISAAGQTALFGGALRAVMPAAGAAESVENDLAQTFLQRAGAVGKGAAVGAAKGTGLMTLAEVYNQAVQATADKVSGTQGPEVGERVQRVLEAAKSGAGMSILLGAVHAAPEFTKAVLDRSKNGMISKTDAPESNRDERKSMYEELTKAQSQPPAAAPAEATPAQPPEQPNVPQEENVQQATEPQAGEELGQSQPAGPETGKEDVGQQADEKPAAVEPPMPGDPLPPGTAASVLPIPPGVERDLNVFAAGVGKVAKSLRETFSPTGVSAESKGMAGIVRENASELAKRHQQAKAALDKFGRGLMKMPLQARYDFIDGVETGSSQPTPELDDAATAMRTLLDDARERIRDLGTGKLDNFIQDYFPHIWKDPAKAEQVFGVGKRPLEGSKAFLKERTIPTTKEGLAKGLEPVSDNPVDLVLLKLHEMNRYEMAQKILKEGKDVGYVKLARTPGSQPDGWVKINDKIGTVWQRKPTVKEDGTEGAPEFVHRGDYYAHPDAGRILNSDLLPGLRGNSVYDAIRFAGNAMNMSQLGLSFFHLIGTTINAIVSRAALAAKLAVEGKPLAAVKMAANAWTAPFSTILGGSKVLNEALRPGSQGQDFAQVVDALQAGGFRLRQDDIYRLGKEATTHWEGFMKALKEGRPSMVPQAFLAAIEQSARPMMEVYIPRMKLGVMLDMARYELEKMPAGATRADVREAMRGVVDSVDNRLGQLVYDNLFWNKTMKDVLMVSTRSLGWNIGTVRELAGGAKDLAKIPLALLRGKRPELTHAASYTLALPFVAGILGSAMAYMYNGRGPQSLMDMYHVPTGNGDDKVQLPTYMRDVFSWATHPGKTLISKTHPLLAATVQMLQNKDFYNHPITNPDDPLIAQAEELGKYVLSQFLPFSIRNAEERKGKKGQPASTPTMQQRAETLIGITPVPKDPKPTKKQLVH